MKERLSIVYLDNYPVTLMGDEAAPPLSRIVRAGGKRPERVDVELLKSPSDKEGRPVELTEIIDRAAEPTRPIYLRTIPRDVKPIYTADPGHALSRPEVRQAILPDPAMPNVDPVIAQLGAKPIQDRPPHQEAVFRSPSQMAAEAAPPAQPDSPPAAAAPAKAEGQPRVRRSLLRAEAQADAEAQAEQRQEDERNLEDTVQDDDEAARQTDEDAETQS